MNYEYKRNRTPERREWFRRRNRDPKRLAWDRARAARIRAENKVPELSQVLLDSLGKSAEFSDVCSYPVNLNLREIELIQHIEPSVNKFWGLRQAALAIGLLSCLGCTAKASPPPQPPITCTTPVTTTVTSLSDASGRPLSIDKLETNPPICACSDSVVRLCGVN